MHEGQCTDIPSILLFFSSVLLLSSSPHFFSSPPLFPPAYLPRRGGDNIIDVLDNELTQLIWEASRSEAELMRLFRKFDRRGTGRISRRDFSNAVQKLGALDALFIIFIGH